MVDDVVINKAASIERCLRRIQDEYAGNEQNLIENQTKQDAIILNLQRACETAIDLAMYVVSTRKLGVPQDSRDAYALLQAGGCSPPTSHFACSGWSVFATWRFMNIPTLILTSSIPSSPRS